MLRTIRISFSITCVLACVLLIALWMRSYRWRDSFSVRPFPKRVCWIESAVGQFAMRISPKNHDAPSRMWSQIAVASDPAWPANNRFGFNAYMANGYAGIVVPHWLLILLTAVVAATFGVHSPFGYRFGLRILLTAASLVAALLGAMYVLNR